MGETALIALTLFSAGVTMIIIGSFSVKGLIWLRTGKEATFYGADFFHSSISQIGHKYMLKIYTASWVGAGCRIFITMLNIAGMVFLLYKSLTGRALELPTKFYYSWISLWISTIAWVFIIDREMQVLVSAFTFLLHVIACVTLHTGCQFYYQRSNGKAKPNEAVPGSLFRYLVLESMALYCTWSVLAFTMSFATMLAYKDSLHSEIAIPTGFLTPDESVTIGLVLVLVRFIIWWIFDVTYWGKCSDVVNAIYPMLAVVTLSVTTNNYDSNQGMTLNNIISLTVSILSVLAFLTRSRAKEFFLEYRQSTRSHRD